MNVTSEKNKIVIKNFMGEKAHRELPIFEWVVVKVNGQEIIVESSNKESAGNMAAAGGDVRKEDAVAGEVVRQVGTAYGELGDAASSYAYAAFNQANIRLKATQSGRDFMFIMSKLDKDIVLLKVSKITGKVEGKIDLGKDREPIYALDDVTGQVYYLSDDKTLTSYQAN